MKKCNEKCEVYARAIGYIRPIDCFNKGLREQYGMRKMMDINPFRSEQEDEIQEDCTSE